MSGPSTPLSEKRERDCKVERRALEMWLALLTPVRWLTVSGITILSAIAAATILGKPAFFGEPLYSMVAGLCALGASILSGLHTALHCDAHQAECSRLAGVFAGLEAGYQAAQISSATERKAKEQALEKTFTDTITGRTATPPVYFRRRAARELERESGASR
ncbi:MAG: hypothetical protein ABR905_06430 [Terracidiphilus sp.]|jgi:hypothetical protein